MAHKSSTNDGKNPYQVPSKVNLFWHDKVPGSLICYSQETKDHLDQCAKKFREFKGEWLAKPKKKKEKATHKFLPDIKRS